MSNNIELTDEQIDAWEKERDLRLVDPRTKLPRSKDVGMWEAFKTSFGDAEGIAEYFRKQGKKSEVKDGQVFIDDQPVDPNNIGAYLKGLGPAAMASLGPLGALGTLLTSIKGVRPTGEETISALKDLPYDIAELGGEGPELLLETLGGIGGAATAPVTGLGAIPLAMAGAGGGSALGQYLKKPIGEYFGVRSPDAPTVDPLSVGLAAGTAGIPYSKNILKMFGKPLAKIADPIAKTKLYKRLGLPQSDVFARTVDIRGSLDKMIDDTVEYAVNNLKMGKKYDPTLKAKYQEIKDLMAEQAKIGEGNINKIRHEAGVKIIDDMDGAYIKPTDVDEIWDATMFKIDEIERIHGPDIGMEQLKTLKTTYTEPTFGLEKGSVDFKSDDYVAGGLRKEYTSMRDPGLEKTDELWPYIQSLAEGHYAKTGERVAKLNKKLAKKAITEKGKPTLTVPDMVKGGVLAAAAPKVGVPYLATKAVPEGMTEAPIRRALSAIIKQTTPLARDPIPVKGSEQAIKELIPLLFGKEIIEPNL